MQTQQVSPSQLSSHWDNDWNHAEQMRVDNLAHSMREDGFKDEYALLTVGENHKVLNGRHRAIAAQKAGVDSVPVLNLTEDDCDRLKQKCGSDYERMTDIAFFELEG